MTGHIKTMSTLLPQELMASLGMRPTCVRSTLLTRCEDMLSTISALNLRVLIQPASSPYPE